MSGDWPTVSCASLVPSCRGFDVPGCRSVQDFEQQLGRNLKEYLSANQHKINVHFDELPDPSQTQLKAQLRSLADKKRAALLDMAQV